MNPTDLILPRVKRQPKATPTTKFAYELKLTRSPIPGFPSRLMSDPAEVAKFLYSLGLAEAPEERFVVLGLDTRNALIAYTELTRGTVDRSIVHPREVFRFAVLAGASRIFLAHNHPSGDLSPSPQDLKVTESLRDAGQVVGIEVLDHLIVGYSLSMGQRHYTSLRERGCI